MLDWQLDFIRWLQSFSSPSLDRAWLTLTHLGDESFYLLAISLLYWVGGPTVGFRGGVLVLVSLYVNGVAKLLFQTPRPFMLEGEGITALPEAQATAAGGAFPSGHAQGATVLWTYLAIHFRRWWLGVLAVVLILLISLSRLYLGVHWPQDVLGGWVLGLTLVGIGFFGCRRWPDFGSRYPTYLRLLGVLPVIGAMLLVGPWWSDGYKVAATLLGVSVGHVVCPRRSRPRPAAWWAQVIAVLLALVILGGLREGLKPLLPENTGSDCLRYLILGLWVTLGAPWLGQAWLPGLARGDLAPASKEPESEGSI